MFDAEKFHFIMFLYHHGCIEIIHIITTITSTTLNTENIQMTNYC